MQTGIIRVDNCFPSLENGHDLTDVMSPLPWLGQGEGLRSGAGGRQCTQGQQGLSLQDSFSDWTGMQITSGMLWQVTHTFSGPQDLDVVQHMRDCNPRGPLIIQVAKLFPKQVRACVPSIVPPALSLPCLIINCQALILNRDMLQMMPAARPSLRQFLVRWPGCMIMEWVHCRTAHHLMRLAASSAGR